MITRRQAAALGLDSRRIATAIDHGWLLEPYPGVLCVRGAPSTYKRELMAAVTAGGGHAAASHRSAARLHRLDGFTSAPAIELSVDRRHRWPFSVGVITHHIDALDPCHVVLGDGIPTTTVARTLTDLGSVVRDRRVVGRALTDARRRGTSLALLRDTADRLHRPGQRGTGTLLRLLDAIPFGGRVPDSWFEELLAACLADPRIPEIVPQYEITDDSGRFVARVDLAIPSVRLGLEAHSRQFHFGPQAEALDEQRDVRVAACGWELLYVGWHSTKRPTQVADAVADVVRARTREG